MKFTINKTKFLKVLSIASIAVGQKSPTAAFFNYKLEMFDDKLTVTGSNGDLTITSSCLIKEGDKVNIANYETGKVLISAKFLLDIVRNLSCDIVTVEIVDDVIARISDEKSQFKLNALNAEEYPDLDLEKRGEVVVFETDELKKIITQTAFAASTKEVRPVLTALNARANGEKIEFTATDSFRLSKKTFNLNEPSEFVANIPVKTITEVSKILEDGEVEVTVALNKVVFTYGETTIHSRLIGGEFPKTNNMFPKSSPYVLQINSEKFIGAMQRVSLLAVERENIVKLSIASNKCTISSKSDQIGSANEFIDDFKYAGDLFEISFNVAYVIDAIKAAQSEEVILSFVGEMSPFVISSPVDDSLTQIVTPVRSYL